MGIKKLFSFVKEAIDDIHIRNYAGMRVAVDTYCWIHRGCFPCADKLAQGENTDQYVKYCMKFVSMLESYKVTPVLVFDGCRLPAKEAVEKDRHQRRKENLARGKQLLREGNASGARDCFTKCVNVTPKMALSVMQAARDRGVDCIVAPYEADAQLAYLLKRDLVDAIITEDSDLLCFGCKSVIFKLDLTGRCQRVELTNLGRVPTLVGFTPDLFRHLCILSGCDYLANVKGVGLIKACKALKLSKGRNTYQVARKLHQYVKGLSPVDDSYGQDFERADKTFLYQLVFDPIDRKIVPLNPYNDEVRDEDMKFAGPSMSNDLAFQIALGNVDVNVKKTVGNFNVDAWLRHGKGKPNSIWSKTVMSRHDINTGAKFKEHVFVNKTPVTPKEPLSRRGEAVLLSGPEALLNLSVGDTKPPVAKKISKDTPGKHSSAERVGNDLSSLITTYISPAKTENNRIVKSRFFCQKLTELPKPEESSGTTDISYKSLLDGSLDDVISDQASADAEKAALTSKYGIRSEIVVDNTSLKRPMASSIDRLARFSRTKKKRLEIPVIDIPTIETDQSSSDAATVTSSIDQLSKFRHNKKKLEMPLKDSLKEDNFLRREDSPEVGRSCPQEDVDKLLDAGYYSGTLTSVVSTGSTENSCSTYTSTSLEENSCSTHTSTSLEENCDEKNDLLFECSEENNPEHEPTLADNFCHDNKNEISCSSPSVQFKKSKVSNPFRKPLSVVSNSKLVNLDSSCVNVEYFNKPDIESHNNDCCVIESKFLSSNSKTVMINKKLISPAHIGPARASGLRRTSSLNKKKAQQPSIHSFFKRKTVA